jgi:hypothetical protein
LNRRLRDGGSSGSEDFVLINLKEQKKNAQAFIKRWEDRGNERQDSQSFWLDLLQSVYGIEKPSKYITFEDKVMLDHTSFIDGFIDTTKVLIEQKGADKDLNKAIKQSDGTFLTPFQQAKRYSAKIVYNNFPWPEVTEAQKEKISKTAQAILDARALHPESSLADLYDESAIPAELRRAHQANDKAVMEAYDMTKIVDGKKTWLTESETVARLFEMYEEITK